MQFIPRSLALFAFIIGAGTLSAADRITQPVDVNHRTVLKGHLRPEVQPQNDQGLADSDMEVAYATLLLKLDPSIETFLTEQQTPGSPNYRRWLTPDQFGDRFGISTNDMAKVVAWLTSQGLKINDVAKGRHWITFSGSASKVGRALHTEIHNYSVNGRRHFANATDPAIPEALQSVVGGFRGLNNFPSQPMLRMAPVQPPQTNSIGPNDNIGSNHFLAPDDLATIYNITALYNAGIDGTGQTIVIAGESVLNMNDFKLFQSRFNLPPNLPTVMLVGNDPGTNSTLVEADLDLQWSAAVARNASIIYVYATNVFTAAQYAVDQNLGQQMSISFGGCEPYESVAYRAVAQQANAQGMTIFVSSGDSGAATCDRGGPIPEATHGATASWPSSFPEITSVGGTEFNDAGGTFWATTNNANSASALGYIPEVPWNDSNGVRLEGGGGAPSVLFSKPAWQSGPGVPNDGRRDLPDVSLPASPVKYAYLVESSGALLAVGGTSGSSPAWAGISALLNQYLVSKGVIAQAGLGNINPELYRLAQATTDVFHDITTGDNRVPCAQSTPDCVDSQVGFSAGPGYDMATGLGSVDVFKFVSEFATGTSSRVTLTAHPGPSASVVLTATVTGGDGSGLAPTGTVDFITSDVNLGTVTLSSVGPGSAAATLTVPSYPINFDNTTVPGSQLNIGDGTAVALYGGDGIYTGSEASAKVGLTITPGLGSFVVPWVTPNPVPQAGASSWPYTVGLSEKAGVATTVTAFTVNGVNNLSGLPNTNLAAFGSIRVNLAGNNLVTPLNRVFAFSGKDADGKTWTQSITVPFVGPVNGVTPLGPAMSLSSPIPSVSLDPTADPSCQWSQQLIVQETGGYFMSLTRLTVSGADFTAQLPVVFGTTRVAPYGVLQGSLCLPSTLAPGAKTYTVTASVIDGQIGGSQTFSTSGTLLATSAVKSTLSASPSAVTFTDSSSASQSVTLAGAASTWSASVTPKNRATAWLTLPQATGSGPVNMQVSAAGLSSGVYNATVVVTSGTGLVNIPVTLVVNPSGFTKIAAAVNNFSGSTTLAPGEMVAVFGTRMAPDIGPIVASSLPLPFSLHGVAATVNGVSAPMYYVSPTQIDLQIPYETGAGPAVLALNNNGQIAAFPIQVAATAPGLFNTPLDALTGVQSPTVKLNQVLTLYVTGEGDVTPTLASGATPARQSDPTRYPTPRQAVTATVGGVPATVLFAGIPNGIATETQINIAVPPNAPLGKQNIIVSVGSVPSQPISVTINPAQ